MAQQKKKTTTTKKKTTGSSRSSSSGKRTAKKNQKRPIRREVAGAILLVLALCLGFSYFQSGAWLLDQPAKLCRSLFGWGYYLVAPALLLGSYILLFHRGRNVASCLVGTALLPVVFGAIMHIALCKEKYVNMDGILKLLWTSGNALESGGAVSASLAIMLVLLVKKVLAMVLLVVLFVAFLMMAFRLTPAAVMVWSKFMNVFTLAAPRAVMPAAAGSIASPRALTFLPALEISRPIRWLALLVSSMLFRILASPLVTLSWSLMITSIISAIH